MKRRLRQTVNENKQTIENEFAKYQQLTQIKNDFARLSIDVPQQNQGFNRSLGVSTTRVTLTSSLKRSQVFRKLMNHSINSQYRPQTQKGRTLNTQDQQQAISQNEASRVSVNLNIKNIEMGKVRGFQSFLQNKRKSNQKMTIIQFKKSKVIKSTCAEAPINSKNRPSEQVLNLEGKSIIKLRGSQANKIKQVKEKTPVSPSKTAHQWSTLGNDRKIENSIKMRSIQSEHQRSARPSHLNNYVKYVLKEDQGYCLFDKLLNPLSAKRPVSNHKKLFYLDLHKEFKRPKPSRNNQTAKPTGISIDGWVVNSEDEWELSNSQNAPK